MNPHPTKSKPCKIGRKHTGAAGVRKKGRLASAQVQSQKERVRKWKKFNERVAAYFRGSTDTFPEKP